MIHIIAHARANDWHITLLDRHVVADDLSSEHINGDIGGKGIWTAGKTLTEAIEQWQRQAEAHDLPEDYVIHIAKDSWTQRVLRKPSLLER